MKVRNVFKIFRDHIDPVLSGHGFCLQRNTGTLLPWLRTLQDGRSDFVYCQMDKWPWDHWMGTKFTVNFQNSKEPDIALHRGSKFARIGDLLVGKHRQETERLQNSAIAKIRVPSEKEYNDELGFEFADEFVLQQYRDESEPVTLSGKVGDLWLRIVDRDDVVDWASFLAAWLPDGLCHFEELEGEDYMW